MGSHANCNCPCRAIVYQNSGPPLLRGPLHKGLFMTQRQRKFAGTWIILALLIAYPMLVASLHAQWLSWLPNWANLVFFIIAGLVWALPAGMVIKWMARPDEKEG